MSCPGWLKIPLLTISPLGISTTLIDLMAGMFDSLRDSTCMGASVALAALVPCLESPFSNTVPYPHPTVDR